MRSIDGRVAARLLARLVAVGVPSLATATVLVAFLENGLGLSNASAVYLLAVVATAIGSGTIGAVVAAIAGIGLYDYLFTHPVHTFFISDPDEWLNLALLLFVGLVVGELTALQRTRAEVARAREREARELFRISRALATRESTTAVLPEVAAILEGATGMQRVWVSLGRDDATERLAADSRTPTADSRATTAESLANKAEARALTAESRAITAGSRASTPGSPALGAESPLVTPESRPTVTEPRRPPSALPHEVLRRTPGDEPAQWVRVHPPQAGRARLVREPTTTYRVRIEFGATVLGSIWGELGQRQPPPDRTSARLLAAAADQIGQALAQDHLAAEARAAEVSRESDALKSALLQSVSHDLRTPLAAIRAAAGSLRPESGLEDGDRKASVDAIEREVARLDRLVANLLDLSRIEAGALRAQREVFELDDIVRPIVDRLRPQLATQDLTVELGPNPILADPVFLDEIVTNLLENAAKFTPPGAPVRVSAGDDPADGRVLLTIEDGGPGVPDDAIDRIFDKFFHAPGPGGGGSRPGTGIGLAVVRGLAEAMDAEVTARPSALGGLAMDVVLPKATLPLELAEAASPPVVESGAAAARQPGPHPAGVAGGRPAP